MAMTLPDHLSKDHATGIQLHQVIGQYEIGNFKNFVYTLLDWNQKKAAIVDPQLEIQPVLESLASHAFILESVLLTHTHHDHIAGVATLIKLFPQLKIYVGEKDVHRLSNDIKNFDGLKLIKDSTPIFVGDLKIIPFHTPGHSAGEICYFLDQHPTHNNLASPMIDRPYLLTGDTVFIRDCGRTDFPDGSDDQMFHSLQMIKKFPPETVLLVGHHYAQECATTLDIEIKTSPPFLCQTVDELRALV
jgi:glyoxylase-like metal-dependent hydrolase (beta-lactamase superfamily II)